MNAGWRFKWKYVWIWVAVCGISAAPSFLLGLGYGDKAAMLTGILLFVAGYVTLASSPLHAWLKMYPRAHRAFRFGFFVRLAFSLLPLATKILPLAAVPILIDLVSGALVLGILRFTSYPEVGGAGSIKLTFSLTLLATCLQGILLNLIVFGTMLLAFAALSLKARLIPSRSQETP